LDEGIADRIKELLGDGDFEYTVDVVEWTDSRYHHQN